MIVPHNRLTHGEAEQRAVARVTASGWWAMGPEVAQLERELAARAHVRHAVCVGSGLGALRLALGALGVGPGDRVVVPAYSCVALANAVLSWGATPVPADVESGTWNLALDETRRAAEKSRARAAVAVHTFGVPAAVELADLGLPVVEDCAHAFGTSPGGRALGSRTGIGILSLHATKLVGAGEGGAVLTDSEEAAEFVRSWRDYADQAPEGRRLNDKMTEPAAALARCQLERLPDLLAAREARALRYQESLGSAGAFELPRIASGRLWYRYAVELLDREADDVVSALAERGVGAARPVESWLPAETDAWPVARRALRRLVSLPLYPTLTEEEQMRVIEAFLATAGSR